MILHACIGCAACFDLNTWPFQNCACNPSCHVCSVYNVTSGVSLLQRLCRRFLQRLCRRLSSVSAYRCHCTTSNKPAAQASLNRSFTKVRFSIISCRWKRSTVNSTRITSRPTQTAPPPPHIISALPELQFPRNRTITCQKPSISFELPLPIERYIY